MRQSVDLDLPKAKKDRSVEFSWIYVFVTGATGLAMFAVSSSLRAVGWAFADLRRCGQQRPPSKVTLALFGVVFVGLSIAGRATIRRRPVADPARSKYRTAAVVLSAMGYAVAVVGAGRYSAHSAADKLRPILGDEAFWLNTTGSNGVVILLVAVAFSGAGLVALTLGRGSGGSQAVGRAR